MKLRRSRKALSPVIASIILIAVTVAVSIAVAAWMGALTFNFMATEQGQITFMQFTAGANGVITVTFNNTGTTKITLNTVYVNNVVIAPASWAAYVGGSTTASSPATVPGNTGAIINVTTTVTSGYQYDVKLISAKGNTFEYTGSAPS